MRNAELRKPRSSQSWGHGSHPPAHSAFRIPHSAFTARLPAPQTGALPMRRLLVSVLAGLASPLSAQSLLFRSPNLSGTWVPDAGVVQFNFLHRFYVSSGPSHGVANYPTFTL